MRNIASYIQPAVLGLLACTALAFPLGVTHHAVAGETPQPEAKVYPIHFPTGSSKLDAADQDTIRGVAASLQGNSALMATVIGKTDTVGSAELNEKLSQRRAEAIFEALVYTNHVPENRVDLRWTGEHLPYLSTEDEKEEALNRVVEIIVH